MQLDGEDEHVPIPVPVLNREMVCSAQGTAIDVSLAGVGDGADDL